jgi:hypothetical protein
MTVKKFLSWIEDTEYYFNLVRAKIRKQSDPNLLQDYESINRGLRGITESLKGKIKREEYVTKLRDEAFNRKVSP